MVIEVLELNDGVRKRPYMYFGALEDAPYRIFEEFLCLAREAACCRDDVLLNIALLTDGRCRITFTGALPVEPLGVKQIPTAQRIMTEVYACRDLKPENRKEFCTVSIAAANALCSDVDLVVITSENKRYFQFYSKGKPISPFESSTLTPEASPNTTIFKFRIDPLIYPKFDFDCNRIVDWVGKNIDNVQTVVHDTRTGMFFQIYNKGFR